MYIYNKLYAVLLAIIIPGTSFANLSDYPPACPREEFVKTADLDSARVITSGKDKGLYRTQTFHHWIPGEDGRNWLVTVGGISANSKKQALNKANNYLKAGALTSLNRKATAKIDRKNQIILWTCAFKDKKQSEISIMTLTITAMAESAGNLLGSQ